MRYLTDNRSVTLKRVQEVTQQAADDSRRSDKSRIDRVKWKKLYVNCEGL